jgi:hypothetical protein
VKRRAEARLSALWLTIGLALSLGPVVTLGGVNLPGPFELFRLLPGGALLRTPSRLAVLTVLGLDMLAALAWVHFVKPLRTHRVWLVLAVALVAIELFPTEVRGAIREMPRPRPVAEWLSRAQEGVVLELPWYEPADAALYLFWSTVHWQPMINGFGSFDPPGNFGLGLLGNRWPSAYSAGVFRQNEIRYVVVHVDRLKEGHRQRLLATGALPAGVTLAASLGPDRVYEIEPLDASGQKKEKPSQSEGFSAHPR